MAEEETKKQEAEEQKIEKKEAIEEKQAEKQEEKQKEEITEKQDTNIIFIGEKPFMNYVTAVVTQFKTKKQSEVIVKARGKFISRAVDVAEVSAKKFLKEENIKVKNIIINSEEFENKEGRKVNVSTIEITLEKHKS